MFDYLHQLNTEVTVESPPPSQAMKLPPSFGGDEDFNVFLGNSDIYLYPMQFLKNEDEQKFSPTKNEASIAW